ncbi:MAG: hypothetical protein ACR2J6_06905 [Thermoleophilaceae bacterium]
MRRLLLFTVLGATLIPAGIAQGASAKYLWATVNSCDNGASSFGIRASMPGNGTNQRMYMRFSAQFRNAAGRFVETGSSSRFIRVGTARRRSVQSGFDFDFDPPPVDQNYVFRGTVNFRWTARKGKRRRVVRSATRTTRPDIEGVQGGSPRGRSDAACLIQR